MRMNHLALEYLKDRYNEESSRFEHLESKCEKFISLITIIIAVIAGLVSLNGGDIIHPKTKIEWFNFIIFTFACFSIVCCWGHSLLALKIGDTPTLPRSIKVSEYFEAVNEELTYLYIYNAHKHTIQKLSDELQKKEKNLEIAYTELVISAWLLSVATCIKVYTEIMT